MTGEFIEVQDQAVTAALNQLAQRAGNASPVLKAIGEDIIARAKARFSSSTGPDGQRWAANAQSTIEAAVGKKGGFGKNGKITAKGQIVAMGKKPLIGESGDLRRNFWFSVIGNALEAGNSSAHAAPNQFGTKAHVILPKNKKALAFGGLIVKKVNHPGIVARAFFPVTQDGRLYPAEQSAIMETIADYLVGK